MEPRVPPPTEPPPATPTLQVELQSINPTNDGVYESDENGQFRIFTMKPTGGSDYIYDILGTNPFDAMAGVNFRIDNGVGIIFGTGEEDGSNLVALTTTLTIRTTDGSGINSHVDVVAAITINPLPITVTATAAAASADNHNKSNNNGNNNRSDNRDNNRDND